MRALLLGLTLSAAACSPSDILANQGSSLRNTDLVQTVVNAHERQAAEQDRINKVAQSAQAHVDLFEYPAAVADWKEAYRMSTEPVYLERVAESSRAMGDCGEAQLMYQQYLDKTNGAGPDAVTVRARLDEARKCQTRLGSNADRVHQLYASGSTHYQISEYDLAIRDFKEAYRLSDDPAYLFNIAQSLRLKRNCGEAMRYYERYLATAGDIPNRPRVQQRVDEMRACAR
jgi:tetratricopeptide (TPR) repeat protein